jgi:dipeptidyl aminopeptidase/acylaminoacyl peptidase
VEHASSAQFTHNSGFAVLTVVPKYEETLKATREKKKAEDRPKNSLVVIDLTSGEKIVKERIQSWSLSPEGTWVLYREVPPKPDPKKKDEAKKSEPEKAEPKKEGEEKQEEEKSKKKTAHKPGNEYILWNLADGSETKLQNIVRFSFSAKNNQLAYVVSDKTGEGDGIRLRDLGSGQETAVVTQLGQYKAVALNEDGSRMAFVSDKDDYEAKKPSDSLFVWSGGAASMAVSKDSDGVVEGETVSTSGLRFSKSGRRVLFSIKRAALPEKLKLPDDEKVSVDVWSWTDPLMMPQQLMMRSQVENRTYQSILDFGSKQMVRIADDTITSVNFGRDNEFEIGLGTTNEPYLQILSWGDMPQDVYLVDAKTGKRTMICEGLVGRAQLTPAGKYAMIFDGKNHKVYSVDVRSGRKVELTENIDDDFFDVLDDHPSVDKRAWGLAGSTEGDQRIFLNSTYDIWSIDPTGNDAPLCVTANNGRNYKVIYRRYNLDSEQVHIDTSEPVLLSAGSQVDYQPRYAWGNFDRGGFPRVALEADGYLDGLSKSKESNTVMYRVQRFDKAADLYVSDMNFGAAKRVSDIQKQVDEYRWGKAELVRWISSDGAELDGILYIPDDLDLSKKHPMVTYFYEKNAQNLHRFRSPAPSASTINIPLFVSQGYVVFVPDIPYKIGYPGESAMSAIVPGVHKVIDDYGFIDKDRVGIQGQSWGGYQVAYLVTETDMFAAGWAGAPVSNMFSAYGGIRWGSGLVRTMQYEVGQTRIGGTIWDSHLRYIENSPLFHVDKIKTPLAIMHNDSDGAVPWYQGIEMFAAMRRLQKPCWLLVYNGEQHNLMQRKNRKDLSIRLSQFFDHYLKDAPAPVWMTEGVPGYMKGRTMGTEIKKEKD